MDRAVLITGASRGIGAAVARRFAREGWRVGVNYRTSRGRAEALAAEIAAAGGQTALLPGDVSDPAQAAALVRAAEELCPRVREISNMGTPWLLATEAKLCRRPWREILGSPCRRTTVSRSRVSWSGLGGAPSCRSTTHSFGSSLRRLSHARRSTCCSTRSGGIRPKQPADRCRYRSRDRRGDGHGRFAHPHPFHQKSLKCAKREI